jgi:5'-3' exonuclease
MGWGDSKALALLDIATKKKHGMPAAGIRTEVADAGGKLGYDAFPLLHAANAYIRDFEAKECAIYLHDGVQASAGLPPALKRVTCQKIQSVATQCQALYQATPVLIFDGQRFPCKRGEQQSRKQAYEGHLIDAKQAEAESIARNEAANEYGRQCDRENESKERADADRLQKLAKDKYKKACQFVCWEQVQAAMEECNRLGIKYIVALYEADSQIARALINRDIDMVVMEDSDIILYLAQYLDSDIDLKVMFGGVNAKSIQKGEGKGRYNICITDIKADIFKDHTKSPKEKVPINFSGWPVHRLIMYALLTKQDYTQSINQYIENQGPKLVYRLIMESNRLNTLEPALFREELTEIVKGLSPELEKLENEELLDQVVQTLLDCLYAITRQWVFNAALEPVRFSNIPIPIVEPLSMEHDEALVGVPCPAGKDEETDIRVCFVYH